MTVLDLGPGCYGQHGDWSGQLVDSGLAASEAADRVTRELDRASLKRPDRGVPPPRSGLPAARCAVMRDTRDSAPTAAARLHCRLCDSDRLLSVLDLGATPPCEKFLTPGELDLAEPTFPLHLRLCEDCLLLQIPALIMAGGRIHRTLLFFFVFGHLGPAREDVCQATPSSGSAFRPSHSWWRSPAMTAICSNMSSRRAYPAWESSRR